MRKHWIIHRTCLYKVLNIKISFKILNVGMFTLQHLYLSLLAFWYNIYTTIQLVTIMSLYLYLHAWLHIWVNYFLIYFSLCCSYLKLIIPVIHLMYTGCVACAHVHACLYWLCHTHTCKYFTIHKWNILAIFQNFIIHKIYIQDYVLLIFPIRYFKR